MRGSYPMKLKFLNAEPLMDGIKQVQDVLEFEITDTDADLVVTAEKIDGKKSVSVSRKGEQATIRYSEKCTFFRGLSILCQTQNTDFEVQEEGHFKTNGAMFDMSRNSVFKVETIQTIMKYMALMGQNLFMLYTEDTYTVPGHPYFGHMRGRYSREEIQAVERFGEALGIELVPCIQTLAHLETALRWEASKDLRDTHDTLLADSEETYALIEDMFKSLSEMYHTRRVHIGMDEAHYLGRGAYLDQNGYQDQAEIFCRHLNRCREIAKKYGFRPMMWSDMFFRMASGGEYYAPDVKFSDVVKEKVPKDVEQVYWHYGEKDQALYEAMLDRHHELTDHTIFAGGFWAWTGPCPAYGITVTSSVSALQACMNRGVDEVIATVWQNGAECPLVFSLLALTLYAEMDYTGGYDLEKIKERFTYLTKVDADDILMLDLADHPDGGSQNDIANPTRFLLYNDPLAGLMDKDIEGIETQHFYEKISQEYKTRGQQKGFLLEAFNFYRAVISVMEKKADFGLRLKAAYDQRNQEALQQLYDDSIEIEHRIETLQNTHRSMWLFYNKAFGFELFDMIYGALRSRFETLRVQLDRLFADPGYVIDELEEERLYSMDLVDGKPKRYNFMRFARIYSANVTTTISQNRFLG